MYQRRLLELEDQGYGLHAGDKITIQDLLYGLMLKSGNDCAIALAEYVGNSVDNFAQMMNSKAKKLGLKRTNFVTVNGLDEDEHYTTALELAKITDYALKNNKFKEIVGTMNYIITINGQERIIENTNELLGNLNGVYGVKTGFTNGANRCLVTSIKRGNMDTICVVLGADTKKDRTKDSIKIIEYIYSNYEMVNIEEYIEKAFNEWNEQNQIAVIKGQQKYLELKIEGYDEINIPVYKQETKDIEIKIENLSVLNAPIEEGRKIGEIKLQVKGKTMVRIDMSVSKNVDKKNIKDYYKEMLTNISYYFEDFLSARIAYLNTVL